MDQKTNPLDRYRAPALDKGLEILELLAGSSEGMSQAMIARELGRSANEIYRMLNTLVRRGYLTRDSNSDLFHLSLKLFTISHRHPPIRRLIDQAMPLMRQAARRAMQSCHIGIERDGEIAVIAVAEAPGNWGISLRVGSIIGLHNTGTGRVLAAYRSPENLRRLIESHNLADGEGPMPIREFRRHLKRIRADGYEHWPSGTTMGVINLAFPIFGPGGEAIAVLSCPYLERIDGVTTPGIEQVKEIYWQVARDLSMSTPDESAKAAE